MLTSLSNTNQTAMKLLRQRYPWPIERPDFDPIDWSMDGGGRWMVTEKIRRKDMSLVLEIGSFLGGSIRDWLAASPTVNVVAVDPWPASWDLATYARENHQCERVAKQLGRENGFYQTFLTNLWDNQDRVIPVKEYSPAILYELSSMGLEPDLIYLDSDKVGTEIELCRELFPNAIMTGDDWCWTNADGECSIRQPVYDFCEKHGRYLKVERATWIIDNEPPSLAFQIRSFRRALKAKWRERRYAKRELAENQRAA
ncbi:hypothetical protein SH528x_001690 [Novipirellula sp. SH528]|uniref:hypothetical protein n=1 Tax=Novipirellula sp. SH528 TaxID=3454466 RepID=UPI003FA0C2C9